MVVGSARRLRQASQAASMIASKVSNTRFESQFWRRYCQMFSTGLSSGVREGRKTRVMFFGTTRRPVVCQPAGVGCKVRDTEDRRPRHHLSEGADGCHAQDLVHPTWKGAPKAERKRMTR